jgi:hypothetical protein
MLVRYGRVRLRLFQGVVRSQELAADNSVQMEVQK